jgi:hypothetical protein
MGTGWGTTSQQYCPELTRACVAVVQGSLKGGGTSWTPAVYSRTQQDAVLSFYRCGVDRSRGRS